MFSEGSDLDGKLVAVGMQPTMSTETVLFGFLVLIVGFFGVLGLMALMYWVLAIGTQWAERE